MLFIVYHFEDVKTPLLRVNDAMKQYFPSSKIKSD